MRICIFEDAGAAGLNPLCFTRPVFDLRCGTGTLLERIWRHFPAAEVGVQVRPGMEALTRLTHPQLRVNDSAWIESGGETVFVNARWLAPADPPSQPPLHGIGVVGEDVAWAVLSGPELVAAARGTMPASDKKDRRPAGGSMISHLWQLVEANGQAISDDFSHWRQARDSAPFDSATVLGPVDRVFVDPGAQVEPLAILDVTNGPIVIDQGAVVHAFSHIEGPCYVGPDSKVLGARIRAGTTLGKGCRVGGEVECSILHGFVNKYHDGFVGHSYVGGWVNFGAGSQVSDLRNDYGSINVILDGEKVDTELIKVGGFFGDYTRMSVGTLLNAGTVVGPFGQLLANGGLLPRSIPAFCQFEHGRLRERSDLRLMFDAAATAVGRRDREWTATHVDFFFKLYVETEPERRKAIREYEQRRMRRVV